MQYLPPLYPLPSEPSMHRVDEDLSLTAPLRQPVYRVLWMTWLTANMCMWMNDVAAAWMMTSLSSQPIWVALVQTASTLPMFLLGLPSGALADILDRKRYFLVTQLWVAIVATVLSAMIFFGQISPLTLLLLTFANGIGLAMRWPVFSAIVPELVNKPQLPAALALNGVSMNASRIMGPLIAGALIAGLGSAWVFLLNACLSLLAAATISRWKHVHIAHPLGREKLGTAMRVGLQYVMQSYLLKGVLLRIWIFFFHSTALLALLPLLAMRLKGGNASTFTLLIASMGLGAIASAGTLPALRRRYRRDGLVARGAGVFALAMATVALTDHMAVAICAMFCGGMAWIATANTLSLSNQLGLPDWVRARHVDLPDGTDGGECQWRGCLGANRHLEHRIHQCGCCLGMRTGRHVAGQSHHAGARAEGRPYAGQVFSHAAERRCALRGTRHGDDRVPGGPGARRGVQEPDAGPRPAQPLAPWGALMGSAA
jgi:MFS family permease